MNCEPTFMTHEIARSVLNVPLAFVVQPLQGKAIRYTLPTHGEVEINGARHTHEAHESNVSNSPILIDDPAVSMHHAKLELHQGQVHIVDLQSRNGTWVGGVRVESATLSIGSCVVIGRTVCVVEAEKSSSQKSDSFDNLKDELIPGAVGRSFAMQKVAHAVRAYAPRALPVLLRGESGSGKELVARAMHTLSPRASGPFHAINLGALPRELAESELFGHERGAFTGANTARPGVFELAHGGTLLLDELGELPIDMQAKLLRVLENGEIRRLGARASRHVDVRVIAATWAPLEQRIAEGSFREDLFHRIAVLVVDIPPLRERRGDIAAIAQAMLHHSVSEFGPKELSPAAISRLCSEPWPGNVRELRNVLYRAAVHSSHRMIEISDITQALSQRITSYRSARRTTLDRQQALSTVMAYGGNIAAAARAMGVPRETLRDWVRIQSIKKTD